MAPKLSVNINAIALLRNRRDLPWPDLLHFARIALSAGADGLTVHPRPDERHVRFSDLKPLCDLVRSDFPSARFTIEGYPSERFLEHCIRIRPDQVTLVPDDDAQTTSDHGWDIGQNVDLLAAAIARLAKSGTSSSVFINPDETFECMNTLASIGAHAVEIFTGRYAGLCIDGSSSIIQEVNIIKHTAEQARKNHLSVNAGHDLTRDNLNAIIEAIPFLSEASIGHALISDCLEFGLSKTILLYREKLNKLQNE